VSAKEVRDASHNAIQGLVDRMDDGGGIATGAIVYSVTRSVGWTMVGVLASGIVLNAIGHGLIQPLTAVRRARRDSGVG